MIKKKKIILIIFLVIILIMQLLRKLNMNEFNVVKNIDNVVKSGNLYSISILPTINRDNDVSNEFKQLIYNADKNSKCLNILKKNKISVKIRQLGKNLDVQVKRLENIVDYAEKKNIFIWIASVFKKDTNMELDVYKKLLKKYSNVGLTIATVNYHAKERVKEVIKLGGKVRLVKGNYKGDIQNWDVVTKKYKEIAEIIVDSNQYHCLATHDFKILKYLKEKYPNKFKNIELAFYYTAYDYVYKNIDIIKDNTRCFYIYYGDYVYYIIDNISEINLKRIMERLK